MLQKSFNSQEYMKCGEQKSAFGTLYWQRIHHRVRIQEIETLGKVWMSNFLQLFLILQPYGNALTWAFKWFTSLTTRVHKCLGMLAHVCNLIIWKMKSRGSRL